MGFFDLDSDRIVRIFHANGIKMSLNKAFEVANIIYTAHLERLNEVENNVWTVARKEADERVRVASDVSYDEGLSAGKQMNASSVEYNHVTELVKATLWVEDTISHYNLNKKIRCIKEVRTVFPTLGLRDCKVIIENATGNGYGLNF
jgi:ribosomal protein L7/L12